MAISAYLDANFIIRFVESVDDNLASVADRADAGIVNLITSELALAEVLVGPMRDGDARLVREYESLFADTAFLQVLPVDRQTLRRSADLRATLGNKLPDAIHVATAVGAECQVFLSSDRRIRLPEALTRIALEDAGDMDKWP